MRPVGSDGAARSDDDSTHPLFNRDRRTVFFSGMDRNEPPTMAAATVRSGVTQTLSRPFTSDVWRSVASLPSQIMPAMRAWSRVARQYGGGLGGNGSEPGPLTRAVGGASLQ